MRKSAQFEISALLFNKNELIKLNFQAVDVENYVFGWNRSSFSTMRTNSPLKTIFAYFKAFLIVFNLRRTSLYGLLLGISLLSLLFFSRACRLKRHSQKTQ